MRQAIVDKIEVIEQQNSDLEQRVEERTATIKAVNEELKHLSLHDPLTKITKPRFILKIGLKLC